MDFCIFVHYTNRKTGADVLSSGEAPPDIYPGKSLPLGMDSMVGSGS